MINSLRRIRPKGLDVLALPTLRRLLAAEVLFDVSSNMRLAAQSWVVLELGGSALWVGLAAGARGVPAVLFGLLGGLAADRSDPRRILVIGWAVLAAVAAATALLLAAEALELWHVVALSAVTGTAIAFTVPSAYSLISLVVPTKYLPNALGLISLSWSSMEMTAPAIAGVIIASSGAWAVFWLIAAGYISAILLLMRVQSPVKKRAKSHASVIADLKAGIAYVRRTPPLPVMTLLAFEQNLMAVAIMPLIPVFAKEVLEVGPTGYGLLAGSMGAGFVTGALTISAFGNFPRKGLTMMLAGAVWDGGAVAFGFSSSLALSMVILYFIGLSGPFWFNAAVSTFQAKSSEAMRGRVMSVWATAGEMFPVGWLVGGVIATLFGYREALIISAACGTPVAVVLFFLSPGFRRS